MKKISYLTIKHKVLYLIESKYFYIVLATLLILPIGFGLLHKQKFIPANSLIIQQEDGTFQNKNNDFTVKFGTLDKIANTSNTKVSTDDAHIIRFSATPSKKVPFEQNKDEVQIGLLKSVKEDLLGTAEKGIQLSFVSAQINGDHKEYVTDNTNANTNNKVINTGMELISSGRTIPTSQQGYTFIKNENETNKDTIIQKNIIPGVDIEYQIIEGIGVKEEIIINNISQYSKNCKEEEELCLLPRNSYTFNLQLDKGVVLKQSTSNTGAIGDRIYYFEDDDGRYLFHFLPLFAEDNLGETTTNVVLNIEEGEKKNEYNVEVLLNLDWLLDKSREFPIRIDPSIVHDTSIEFLPGTFNRVKDVGTSSPELITYYQELPADVHTVGLWHFNETTENSCSGGEDVCDFSGNGNHGAFNNTAAFYGSGKLGANAIALDGNSDYIRIPENDILDPKEITLEAWINPTVIQTGNFIDKGSNSGYRFRTHSSGLQFLDRGGTNILTSTIIPQTGTWTHVALVGDSSGLKMYINGELNVENTIPYGGPNTSTDLILGAYGDGSAEYYNGLIDEVRISNIARTPEEIKASASRRPYSIYTSEIMDLGGNVNSFNNLTWDELDVKTNNGEILKDNTNLIAQWNFNDNSGTTIDNAEGTSGYDLTIKEATSKPFGDGHDGSVYFTANTNINTTNKISGRTCTQGGDAVNYSVSSLTVNSAVVTTAPATSCLTAGDDILLINLQGTSTASANTGNYEILEISSISGSTIYFKNNKTKYYGNGVSDDSNIGTATSNQRVMLQRVPNYTHATVNGGVNVYPNAWNGIKNGVIAFKVRGNFINSGTIHTNSMGYRGGAGAHDYEQSRGGESFCNLNGGGLGGKLSSMNGTNGLCGGGGGSAAGTTSAGTRGYASASGGAGAGAGDARGEYLYKSLCYSGGGGGYGTPANGAGTNTSENGGNGIAGNNAYGGTGGAGGTYGDSNLTKLYLGSGGAGGGQAWGYAGSGGKGAGIIYILANNINNTGSIQSKGGNGTNAEAQYGPSYYSGGGGGGAGGSILLNGSSITTGTITISGGIGGIGHYATDAGGNGRYKATILSGYNPGISPSGWSTANKRWGTSALQFDGLDDYAETNSTINYAPTTSTPMTVETWVKFDSINSSTQIIIQSEDGTGTGRTLLGLYSNNEFYTNIGGTALYSNTIAKMGKWYHLAVVYNGSGESLYINGIKESSASNIIEVNNSKLRIGIGKGTTPSGLLSGVVDSTRIYSRALSQDEILSNYNSSNIQFQTRVGADNTPNDGDWELWTPITNESNLETFDNQYLYDITETNLIHYWPMSEVTDNSCSGSEDLCDVKNSMHVNTSGTTINNGAFDLARGFDGINNYIQLMDDTTADTLGTTFSTELWFKSDTYNGSSVARLITRDCSDFFCTYINQAQSYPQDLVFCYDGSNCVTHNAVVQNGWNHTVSTWDGTNSNLYLNGKLLGTYSFTGFDTTSRPILLGDNTEETPNAGASPFKGEIDEVLFYQSAISSTTVQKHYQLGSTSPNSIYPSSNNNIIMQGSRSEILVTGKPQIDSNTVALLHLDETNGSGAYLKDSSKNTNNGTPTGTTPINGISNNARNFNGSSDYITLPSGFNDFTSGFTVELWAKPTSNGNYERFIDLGETDGANNTNIILYRSGTSDDLRIYSGNGSTALSVVATNAIIKNEWHHYAATIDSSGKSIIYRDGILLASGTTYVPVNISRTYNYIGKSNWSSNDLFTGSIDEIHISNIAHTPKEIYESYRLGRDHYIKKSTSNLNLSNKNLLPFYIAADKTGTYLNMTIGESNFANYQADENTIALWHLDDNINTSVSGGTISQIGDFTIHKFTSNGTLNLNSPMNVEYLVVGGGGGGGGTGSGGGAGGYATSTFFDVLGSSYPITIGGGGAGGATHYSGANGGSSVFSTITATGGGGGRTHGGTVGGNGASGSGAPIRTATPAATGGISTSQGNNGGAGYVEANWNGNNAGGGGAGGTGIAGGNTSGSGKGGIGRASSITGSSIYYGGGGGGGEVNGNYAGAGGTGGGGSAVKSSNGQNGGTNTGGGGGGGSFDGSYHGGGNGGSGIVIIKHPTYLTSDNSDYNNALGNIGTTLTNGKLSMAHHFNGSSNYLSPNNSKLLSKIAGKNITIDYWFKTTNHTAAAWGSTVSFNTSTGGNRLLTGIYNSTLSIHAGSWKDGNIIVTDGKWHHAVIILNDSANTIQTYIDGVQDIHAYTNTTSISSSDILVIGTELDGLSTTSDFFNGDIDEIRISDIVRSEEEIQQAYAINRRTHPITIDFAASGDISNIISNSSDHSFTIDATTKGLNHKGEALYPDDKIIVRENYDGIEYIAQATVTSVNNNTGAVIINTWDTGSTFPSGGYTENATVFKWQHEYMDLSDQIDSHVDAINNITFRLTNGNEGRTIWLDGLQANGDYLTNPLGSTITSPVGNRYFQYRAIITSSDEAVSASLNEVTLDYNIGPSLDQIMRHGKWFNDGTKQDYWWVNN